MQDTENEPNKSDLQPIAVESTPDKEDTYQPRPTVYMARDNLEYQKRYANPVKKLFKSTAHYLFFMFTTKRSDTHKQIADKASVHVKEYLNSESPNLISGTNANTQSAQTLPATSPKRNHKGELILISASILLLLIGFAAFFTLQQPTKTKSSNINNIAGVDFSKDDMFTASQKITTIAQMQPMTITIDGISHMFTAQELGVKRDIPGLIELNYQEPPKIIEKLSIPQKQVSYPQTYINKAKFIAAVESKLGQYKVAESATIRITGDKIVVTPSKSGIALNFEKIIDQIQKSAITDNINIDAELTKTAPAISTETAEQAKVAAELFLSKKYAIDSITNGVKQVSQAQKASWINFKTTENTIKIEINIESAKNSLTQIAKSFNKTGKDRITLTLNGQPSTVIDSGQDGIVVTQESIDNMLQKAGEEITAQRDATFDITLNTKTATERNLGNIDGGKFVLVDVSHLKAYAIENNTTTRTMLVSTGTAKMPTPAGHFKIMSKLKTKTMSGCNKAAGCWTVPNVPNVQFFTPQGHALHGTYWHNAFGRENRSHGCVNLSLTDAAWLYNWTEIGTDVIVIR